MTEANLDPSGGIIGALNLGDHVIRYSLSNPGGADTQRPRQPPKAARIAPIPHVKSDAVTDLGEHTQPKFGALVTVTEPHPQNVFAALDIDTNAQVGSPIDHSATNPEGRLSDRKLSARSTPSTIQSWLPSSSPNSAPTSKMTHARQRCNDSVAPSHAGDIRSLPGIEVASRTALPRRQ